MACIPYPVAPLLLLLQLMPFMAVAGAADPTTHPAPAEQAKPIYLSDLLIWTEEVQRRINAVTISTSRSDLASQALPVIQRTEAAVALARSSLSGMKTTEATIAQLMELDAQLSGYRSDLNQLANALTADSTELEKDLDELTRLSLRWPELQHLAVERSAPEEILSRGNSVMAELASMKTALLPVRNQLLSLLARATQQRLALDELNNELLRRRESMDRELRGMAREPLWTLRPTFSADSTLAARQALQAWMTGIIRYIAQQYLILTTIAALVIVLTLILFARGRQLIQAHLPYAPIARGAFQVMARPIWSSLMLTLLALNFSPQGPIAYYDFIWLVILLPAVVLTQAIHGPHLWRSVFALGLMIVAFPFRTFIELLPWLDRWIMASQTLIMATCLWLDWRHIRHTEQRGGHRLWIDTVGIGLVTGLLIGFMANLLGHTGLARVLVDGVIGSLGFAMVYSVALELLFALVAGLLHSPLVAASRVLTQHPRTVAYWLRWQMVLISLGLFLYSCLYAFRIQTEVVNSFQALWEARFTVGTTTITAQSLTLCLLFLAGTWLLIRISRAVLEEEILPRLRLSAGMPFAITTIVRYVIAVVGFVFALLALGLDVAKVSVLAGALGVGIGFGLQNIVNNFISGIILLFERPVHLDDVIELNNLRGSISRIGIRSSTVRTAQGAEVIVPNADLISKEVINWTLSDRRRRLAIPIGVAYGTNPEKMLALLLDTARASPDTLDDPEPIAIFKAFGESTLDFQLDVWIQRYEDNNRIGSDLRIALCQRLAEAGIEIPFPQQDVHIRHYSMPAEGK